MRLVTKKRASLVFGRPEDEGLAKGLLKSAPANLARLDRFAPRPRCCNCCSAKVGKLIRGFAQDNFQLGSLGGIIVS